MAQHFTNGPMGPITMDEKFQAGRQLDRRAKVRRGNSGWGDWSDRRTKQTARVNHKFRRSNNDGTCHFVLHNDRIGSPKTRRINDRRNPWVRDSFAPNIQPRDWEYNIPIVQQVELQSLNCSVVQYANPNYPTYRLRMSGWKTGF